MAKFCPIWSPWEREKKLIRTPHLLGRNKMMFLLTFEQSVLFNLNFRNGIEIMFSKIQFVFQNCRLIILFEELVPFNVNNIFLPRVSMVQCHFIDVSFYQCVFSTTCYFINVSFHQYVISSICHFINMSFHQYVILSICHFINTSFHQYVISSISHFINVSFH